MKSVLVVGMAALLFIPFNEPVSMAASAPQSANEIRDCAAISGRDHNLDPLSAVCEFAKNADRLLPNFTCEQTTQRYLPVEPQVWRSEKGFVYEDVEQRHPDDLIADIVKATVTYEKGADRYTEVRIGARPAEQSVFNLIGPIAMGDFGSELLSIFREDNAVLFTFRERETDLNGDNNLVFDFRIPSRNNHLFTLREEPLATHPDLEGTLWVKTDTNEVSRLDLLVKNIDSNFSADHIRFSTTFEKVPFGDAGDFLLAKQSESVLCDRSHRCRHNVTSWTNCKRLAVKTKIIF